MIDLCDKKLFRFMTESERKYQYCTIIDEDRKCYEIDNMSPERGEDSFMSDIKNIF